jgi:tetratricopeptide (TPR) repeat protein
MKSSSNQELAKTKFKFGNAWQLQGNLETAIEHYQGALALNPQYLGALQQLGNVMLKQRKIDAALEYYEKALSLGCVLKLKPHENRG